MCLQGPSTMQGLDRAQKAWRIGEDLTTLYSAYGVVVVGGISMITYKVTVCRRRDACWTVRRSLNLKWHMDLFQNVKWQELSLQ